MWPFKKKNENNPVTHPIDSLDDAHEALTKAKGNDADNEDTWVQPIDEGELAVDVFQRGADILIQASVGGVRPEDLDIDIDRDIVTIRGQRKSGYTVHEDQYYLRECHWGSFARTIVLPVDVDASRAEAEFKDGVLTITAPRNDRGTSIPIKVTRDRRPT
jgi:HSP20 family protein